MNRIEQIAKLKIQLAKRYALMQRLRPGYDCGHEMAKQINAPYSEACEAVNKTLDELSEIDPNTPRVRF